MKLLLITRRHDLIQLLEEAIKTMKAENKDFGKVLKANGITPPPALPERPKANAEEIPAGARFMDPKSVVPCQLM